MIGLSYDGLIPLIIITLLILILLPLAWLKMGKWQKRLGMNKASKYTNILAYIFIFIEILLLANEFYVIASGMQKILLILAFPVSLFLLLVLATSTYIYKRNS